MFDHKLATEGSVVLVISPLVFLMIDQVTSLRQRNVPAAILSTCRGRDSAYSGCTELLARDSEVTAGRYKLLFGTPEAILGGEKWKEMLVRESYATHLVAVGVWTKLTVCLNGKL